jgi:hypothetical protein
MLESLGVKVIIKEVYVRPALDTIFTGRLQGPL